MSRVHVRHQIRLEATTRLKAAGIVATDSLLPGRRRPTGDAQLPALLVFTDDETATRQAAGFDGSDIRLRGVQLTVRARLNSTGDPPQDALDAIAVQIEIALAGDPELGGLLFDFQLVRTESGPPSPMSDRQLGEIDLVYLAEYQADSRDPTTAIT